MKYELQKIEFDLQRIVEEFCFAFLKKFFLAIGAQLKYMLLILIFSFHKFNIFKLKKKPEKIREIGLLIFKFRARLFFKKY
jgi:hypothetical protein